MALISLGTETGAVVLDHHPNENHDQSGQNEKGPLPRVPFSWLSVHILPRLVLKVVIFHHRVKEFLGHLGVTQVIGVEVI